MDTEALIAQLPALRDELNRWREKEAEAHRKVASLESIIAGIEGLTPGREPTFEDVLGPIPESLPVAETNGAGENLRGTAAVRRAMLEQPDRIWKAKDVHAILEERGWVSPDARWPRRGTEAAINRLFNRGELHRVGTGRYRVTGNMLKEGAEED